MKDVKKALFNEVLYGYRAENFCNEISSNFNNGSINRLVTTSFYRKMRNQLEIWKSEETMASYVRSFYYFSYYWRLASIVSSICLCMPYSVFCIDNDAFPPVKSANDLLTKVEFSDMGAVMNQCNEIEKSINVRQDQLAESRKFLQSFINELNVRYGLSLTVHEACQLVKTNLDVLQITPEQKESLMLAIKLFETGHASFTVTVVEEKIQSQAENALPTAAIINIYWPWEWNWFGLNKHKHHKPKIIDTSLYCARNVDVELPGNCYFGACEVLAGALLCIIPHPAAWTCGVGMIADGGRRIADGIVQLSDERRLDPNFVRPQPPF